MEILDELVDLDRPLVVSKSDGIASQTSLGYFSIGKLRFVQNTYQFFHKRDQSLKVFLDCEMKLVFVLEIDRDLMLG